jgi:tape measure domain-containing protein
MAASIGTAWIQIKPSMQGVGKDIGKQLDGEMSKSDTGFNKFSNSATTALGKIGKFGFTALAATAAATTALIGSRITSAVKRVDTLNNFPRVLQAMGFSGAEAAASTTKLSESLQGLPTALQDGAAGVQRLVSAGVKELPRATNGFLALNNAVLASGGDTVAASRGMDALANSISSGTIQADRWTTITETMPLALSNLGKATGKSTEELREMFRQNPQGLLDAIIELNEKGGDGFSSLEDAARAATGGIGTAWSNLQNAIDRGWEALVRAIGGGGEEGLQKGAEKISNAIKTLGDTFSDVMKDIGEWIDNNSDLINNTLIPALKGVALAIGLITLGFMVATLISGGWVTLIIVAILALGAIVGYVISRWGHVFQDLWDRSEPFRQWLVGAFSAAWDLITIAVNWLIPRIQALWGALMIFWDGAKPVRDFIAQQFKAALDNVRTAFDDLANAIRPHIPLLKWLAKFVGVAALILVGVFVAAVVAAILIILAIIAVIARVITWFWTLGVRIQQAMDRFRNAIVSGIRQAIAIFRMLPGMILVSLGSMGRLLVNSGKAIIDGLVNGIKSHASRVVSAVKGVLQSARDLLPFSPAKEGPFSGRGWTAYSGASLMEGLATGISKAAPKAVGAMRNVVDDLASPVSPDVLMPSAMNMSSGNGLNPPTISQTSSSTTDPSALNTIGASSSRPTHIENMQVTIASDYDATRLLETLGIKQDLFSKGVS